MCWGRLEDGDCGLLKSDNILLFSSWNPPPLPTLPSCPGPGGSWYKAERPQGRGESRPLGWQTKALLLLWPVAGGGWWGGLAGEGALQGGAHVPPGTCTPRGPQTVPQPRARGLLSSPSSGTGIPGTQWWLRAAAAAGTRLRAAADGAGAQPGPDVAAAGSPGLGQPGPPTLGTSGLRPGGQEAFGAAWVPCLKRPLPRPPLSPSPAHSCSLGSGPGGLTAVVTWQDGCPPSVPPPRSD